VALCDLFVCVTEQVGGPFNAGHVAADFASKIMLGEPFRVQKSQGEISMGLAALACPTANLSAGDHSRGKQFHRQYLTPWKELGVTNLAGLGQIACK
jgi:hypothetical protein